MSATDRLATQVLREPFTYLGLRELIPCAQVSKRFRSLTELTAWKLIRQNFLPSTPLLPLETLKERCIVRFEGIKANLVRGEVVRRSVMPLEHGEHHYYSKRERDIFVTIRETSIDVRDFRTRAVIKTLDCSRLIPLYDRHCLAANTWRFIRKHEFIGMHTGNWFCWLIRTDMRRFFVYGIWVKMSLQR